MSNAEVMYKHLVEAAASPDLDPTCRAINAATKDLTNGQALAAHAVCIGALLSAYKGADPGALLKAIMMAIALSADAACEGAAEGDTK